MYAALGAQIVLPLSERLAQRDVESHARGVQHAR